MQSITQANSLEVAVQSAGKLRWLVVVVVGMLPLNYSYEKETR